MRKLLFGLLVLAAAAATSQAVPIVYQQPEMPAGAQNVPGVNTQGPGNQTNPVGATYHYFYANAGSLVTLNGDRLRGPYDMSFGVWRGLYSDTNQIAFFDANFIGFGDDEDAPNIAGPFGDPRISFNAPVTGFYTIAVTNFLSGDGGTQNPYNLDITGNANSPEPLSMLVFGGLLVGGGLVARKRLMKKVVV